MKIQNLKIRQNFSNLSKNNYIKLLCLILFTLFLYYPAIYGEFIWDDYFVFVNDPLMTASNGLWRIWFDPGHSGWNYWPLSRSIFWLQRQLWGLDPQGYHLFNITLHLLNAVILWMALQQFHIRGAWLIGLLFAMHPIHAASVAWATEIKNTFSGLFFLLAFWCFLLFDRHKNWRWYGLSLGLFLLALLSKTATVMLPVLLIVTRFWLQKRWQKVDLLALFPFFLFALGSGCLSIWFEKQYIGTRTMGLSQNILERILVASHTPLFYLEKLLFPHSYIATYPKWNIDITQGQLYLSLMFWIIGGSLVIYKYHSWGRPIALSLCAFLITALPVLGLVNLAGFSITFVWLHLMYLPSIPVFVLLIQGLMWLYEFFKQPIRITSQRAFWGAGILLFIALGVLTRHQAKIYQNEEILWVDTLKKTQSSWMAFHNMGIVHRQKDRTQQALEHFNKALQIDANRSSTYYHRGETYNSLEQYERAVEDYNQAIRLNSNKAEYYSGRGSAYRHLHEYEQAIWNYNHSIELDSLNPKYYNNRANAYFMLKQHEQAISDYNQAIQLNTDYHDAYQNRAKVYIDLKENEKALEDLNRVIRHNPADAKTYNTRGAAYFHLQKYDKAIEDWRKSIELNPNLKEVHKNLALAYYQQGLHLAKIRKHREALKNLSLAIDYKPDLADAYHARGFLYRVIFNDKQQACRDWQHACELGNCENLNLARQEGGCL